MKTNGTGKVIIKVASQEQQENAKNSRRTLKVLQETANKENLAGRPRAIKDTKLAGDNDNIESKQKAVVNKAVQTGEPVVTAEDLTSTDEPSADYWRLLAEKRGDALNESLQENEQLKEHIQCLENENRLCKEMLDESNHLVNILKEMIEDEGDVSTENAEEATENI